MTDPFDDAALRAALDRLPHATGIDADELATGAMRRGRRRRQRRRGAMASASAVAALALAVPVLAATAGTDDDPVDVATEGDGHDGEHDYVDDDRDVEQPKPDGPTTTAPDDDEPAPPKETEPDPEPVEPDEDAEQHEAPKDDPAPPTTEKPDPDPPKEEPDKPEVEALELWCGRGDGEEAGGVVCEVSLSEHPDFHAYKLLRMCADTPETGWQVAAAWGQRTMPDRPWPDIRFFDPDGSPEHPWYYKVVVVDEAGHVIGISNKATVPAVGPPDGGGAGGGEEL